MVSAPDPAVAAYKRVLAATLERRPSGTRQRLAAALGKNRSFISQITNPAYATPIPASHVDTIFELCHFSAAERQQFTAAYEHAHPQRVAYPGDRRRGATVELPDLGDEARNHKLQVLIGRFVDEMAALLKDAETKGRTR